MYNNKEFKELQNEKLVVLNEDDTVEISGGGFCDIFIDIINHFRGK